MECVCYTCMNLSLSGKLIYFLARSVALRMETLFRSWQKKGALSSCRISLSTTRICLPQWHKISMATLLRSMLQIRNHYKREQWSAVIGIARIIYAERCCHYNCCGKIWNDVLFCSKNQVLWKRPISHAHGRWNLRQHFLFHSQTTQDFFCHSQRCQQSKR